jgi:hypothetical protein
MHVGRDGESQQFRFAGAGLRPGAGKGKNRDRGGGERRGRVGRRVGEAVGQLGYPGVVPHHKRGAPLSRKLADQHEQAKHGCLVHPGLVPHHRGGAGRRRLEAARGEFPGLPRPLGR